MEEERSANYIVALGARRRALIYVFLHSYKITAYITIMAEKVKVELDAAPSRGAGTGGTA